MHKSPYNEISKASLHCSNHNKSYCFLNTSKDTKIHLLCESCVKNVQIRNITHVKDVLNFQDQIEPDIESYNSFPNLLPSYWISDENMAQMQCIENKQEDILKEMNQYFSGLEQEIIKKIQQNKARTLNLLQQSFNRSNLQQMQFKCLKRIKGILRNMPNDNLHHEIHLCFEDYYQETSDASIHKNIDKIIKLQQNFRTSLGATMKKQILSLIQSINLFAINNENLESNIKQPQMNQSYFNPQYQNQQPLTFNNLEKVNEVKNSEEVVKRRQLIMNQQEEMNQSINEVNLNLRNLIHQQNIITTLQCKPSNNFCNSTKDLQIEVTETKTEGKYEKMETIRISSKVQSYKQCYLTLEFIPKQKYIIRLQLNSIYQNYPWFAFALVPSSQKDDHFLYQSRGICYHEETGGTTTKIRKGNTVHSGETRSIGKKNLEFRVHIENNVWRVSTYPDYQNIASLANQIKIDPNQTYYFGIFIYWPLDFVIIKEVIEVFQFDNKM